MEGYVDDILVKSMTFQQHLLDLEEFFFILSYHQMKLNPSKYVFAIKGEKDIGFIVSFKGIELNPKKIKFNPYKI